VIKAEFSAALLQCHMILQKSLIWWFDAKHSLLLSMLKTVVKDN